MNGRISKAIGRKAYIIWDGLSDQYKKLISRKQIKRNLKKQYISGVALKNLDLR